MNKVLFLISGKAESGKDTFYNLAKDLITGAVVQRYAFGDEVKKVAREGFGWDGEKDKKGRALLQLIGDGARAYRPDIWIERTQSSIEASIFKAYKTAYFITDCRYPNEIEKMKEFAVKYGFVPIAIRVERPNHTSKLTPEQLMNPSEIALDYYHSFDFVITNDADIEAYRSQVKDVLECLKLNS